MTAQGIAATLKLGSAADEGTREGPGLQGRAAINLLPTEEFEYSRLGRFLRWALSTGRYVVVLTELVVIVAFLSRFWFDRQLTDLRELRIQKSGIVDSFGEVQRRFEQVKAGLQGARAVVNRQYDPAGRLALVQSLTPLGVEYQLIRVSSQSATLTGFAPSSAGFSSLLMLLGQEDSHAEVEVKSLEQSRDRFPGFDFDLRLTVAGGEEER